MFTDDVCKFWMNVWMCKPMDGQMDGWMDEQTDGWVIGLMGKWVNE